jgi:cell division protein FtsN
MLGGLALGLLVALAVFLQQPRPVVPVAAPQTALPPAEPVPVAEPEQAQSSVDQTEDEDEARFDFYDLLPQFEVVVPEVETSVPRGVANIDEPGSYVLQAGSFRELADADRRQAELALLGIESRIQRVAIDDAIYHRVRIGPIEALGDLNRVRRQLRDQRIETMVIRLP